MEGYKNSYVEVLVPAICYVGDPYIITVRRQQSWPQGEDTCYLSLNMHNQGSWKESRQWDANGEARFDLSAYFRVYDFDMKRISQQEGSSSQNVDTSFLKPSVRYFDIAEQQYKYAQQLCCYTERIDIFSNKDNQDGDYGAWMTIWRPCIFRMQGSNHERIPMTRTRYHLINPIFPHPYDFVAVPQSANNNSATVSMSINGQIPTDITKLLQTNEFLLSEGQFGYNTLFLTDYIDESEYVKLSHHNNPIFDADRLVVIMDNHLEPEMEWMAKPVDLTNMGLYWPMYKGPSRYDKVFDMENRFEHLQKFTRPRKDIYLWDSRYELDKLVCLRFLDRFGMVQQICLDLISTDRTVQEGDALTSYKGQDYSVRWFEQYDPANEWMHRHTEEGSSRIANKDMRKTYNLALTAVPKCLAEDFEALMTSPIVVWLRPLIQDVNGEQHTDNKLDVNDVVYTRVYVTASKLTENQKRNTITFTCNMVV